MSVHVFIDHNLRARNNARTDEEESGLEISRSEVGEQLVGVDALCGSNCPALNLDVLGVGE